MLKQPGFIALVLQKRRAQAAKLGDLSLAMERTSPLPLLSSAKDPTFAKIIGLIGS